MSETDLNVLVVEALSDAFEKLTQRLREIANAGKQAKVSITIERITQVLPRDLAKLVTFSDESDCIKVKMKTYLGADAFTRLNRTLRDSFDAEYVSNGKESHFKIKKG